MCYFTFYRFLGRYGNLWLLNSVTLRKSTVMSPNLSPEVIMLTFGGQYFSLCITKNCHSFPLSGAFLIINKTPSNVECGERPPAFISETDTDLCFYLQSTVPENPYSTGFFINETIQAACLPPRWAPRKRPGNANSYLAIPICAIVTTTGSCPRDCLPLAQTNVTDVDLLS